ncbi:hypothetical protein [Streptomyces sp. NPDC002467]|uniref:hypothetical protein n=1 Tax=Streptomyces sp. NPDC002467 TaxID=3364647 RepID=UPI0036C2C8C1
MNSSENTVNAGRSTTNGSATGAAAEVTGSLTALPAPPAEKTHAASQALRESVGDLGHVRTTAPARSAAATAAAAGVLLTGAYALGRRAGRRGLGPITRLTGGRI